MTRPAPKSALKRVWCNRALRHIVAELRASGALVCDLSGNDVEAWTPLDQPPPGACPFCWSAHAPARPHDVESELYQRRFLVAYGRQPTVADALAHCSPKVRQAERLRLVAAGMWLTPPPGVAIIAELYVNGRARQSRAPGLRQLNARQTQA